jgi:hypothetical protein
VGKCIYSNKPSKQRVLFAKAYWFCDLIN